MPAKIKILYVDDEPNNLVGFKAAFRINYDILTAENTAAATACLEKHPDIRIVFCDQRMPDQTGVEFFEKVREDFPLPVRILLTGYADIESVIGAINRGNIFRYVKKPWADTDIISAIEEANNFYLANSMLAIKNTELQKAYDELDKFAYSVSHDLRGPLSGVLGAIHVARDMHDVQEMKGLLNLMEKSVEKLDKYILNMHDYYSLQRGELSITDVDFYAVAEEFRDIYDAYADAGNITFNIKVTQAETFRTDEMALKLIINNLLSNAFKYQKKNADYKTVALNIEVAGGAATISISDTGIGILETYFGEIFNLFSRAISQEAGSGLGLYNVKGALIKLNGQIEVNSVLNSGTTFKVTIPSK
jgi:two-component system sensor histidine kinase/response regulator